jgi:hypothetical protein
MTTSGQPKGRRAPTRPQRGETELDRARAARALLVDSRANSYPHQNEEEVAAFMAIFHPDRELPLGGRYTESR